MIPLVVSQNAQRTPSPGSLAPCAPNSGNGSGDGDSFAIAVKANAEGFVSDDRAEPGNFSGAPATTQTLLKGTALLAVATSEDSQPALPASMPAASNDVSLPVPQMATDVPAVPIPLGATPPAEQPLPEQPLPEQPSAEQWRAGQPLARVMSRKAVRTSAGAANLPTPAPASDTLLGPQVAANLPGKPAGSETAVTKPTLSVASAPTAPRRATGRLSPTREATQAIAIDASGATPLPAIASPAIAADARLVRQPDAQSALGVDNAATTLGDRSTGLAKPESTMLSADLGGRAPQATFGETLAITRLTEQVQATPNANPNPGAALLPGTIDQARPIAPSSPVAPAAHLTPAVRGHDGLIGREMGVAITRAVAEGDRQVTIRLDPVELGRIEVKLAFDDRGCLRAVVAAESPAALDLMRRDAPDLTRALADAGVRSDAQSFRFDSRPESNGGQAWQRQQEARQPIRSQDDVVPAAPALDAVYHPLATSGRINLMA